MHQLQQHHKWPTESNNIQPGTVVLIKDDRAAPLQCKLGVIKDVHYGGDELIRMAVVRVQSGAFRRAVYKLCPLPVDAE